jgi:hypothetical protein
MKCASWLLRMSSARATHDARTESNCQGVPRGVSPASRTLAAGYRAALCSWFSWPVATVVAAGQDIVMRCSVVARRPLSARDAVVGGCCQKTAMASWIASSSAVDRAMTSAPLAAAR